MITAGEQLSRLLKEQKLTKVAFAQRVVELELLTRCDFQKVWKWTQNKGFTRENQRIAARALGVPVDIFECPSAAQSRDKAARALLDQFLQTHPLAKLLTTGDVDVLCSIKFPHPDRQPSRAFFEAVALALTQHIRPDQVVSVATDNAALDRTLATLPRIKRR